MILMGIKGKDLLALLGTTGIHVPVFYRILHSWINSAYPILRISAGKAVSVQMAFTAMADADNVGADELFALMLYQLLRMQSYRIRVGKVEGFGGDVRL